MKKTTIIVLNVWLWINVLLSQQNKDIISYDTYSFETNYEVNMCWNVSQVFSEFSQERSSQIVDMWHQASTGTPDIIKVGKFIGGNGMIPVLDKLPTDSICIGFINQQINGVNKKEYIGINFSEPLKTGVTYTLEFLIYKHSNTPEINIALYGTNINNALPFGEERSMEHPTYYSASYEELGKVTYKDTSDWKKVSITFIANSDYKTLVLGPDEEKSPKGTYAKYYNYYYIDAILLNKSQKLESMVSESAELQFLHIPNVISPNDDGLNDIFTIEAKNMESYTVDIYNKTGNLVNTFTEKENYWDGIEISQKQANRGTYYYSIKAKGADQLEYSKNGSFELLR